MAIETRNSLRNNVKKNIFYHASGYIESFYVDKNNRKQGIYIICSRKTKLKIYECYYKDNVKLGIENYYDENGLLKNSSITENNQIFCFE